MQRTQAMPKILWSFIGIFIVLLFLEMPKTWLFDPDEPRYAEIPREMLASSDFVIPRLNGAHYFEKPPMLYWLNAISMSIFGQTPYAARLTSRLSILGIVFLLLFYRRPDGPGFPGLWAALIFISSPLPFFLARINITDGILSFFLTLAFLSIQGYFRSMELKRSTLKFEWGLGAGVAGAVLSKGVIGLLFPAVVVTIYGLSLKKTEELKALLFSAAPLVFVVLTAPWFLLMEKVNPGFFRFFFVHEHLQRFLTPNAKRQEPFYYFIPILVAGLLPWILPLVKAVRSTFRSFNRFQQNNALFYFTWFAVIFIFFSFSQSKLIPYILPVFPALALLISEWLVVEIPQNNPKKVVSYAGLLSFTALCFLSVIIFLPALARSYSDHDVVTAMNNVGAEQLVSYGTYSQSMPWLVKSPVPVAGFQGELASDDIESPDLFWSDQKFWTHWNSAKPMAAYLRSTALDQFRSRSKKVIHVIAHNRHGVAVTNFSPAFSATRKSS